MTLNQSLADQLSTTLGKIRVVELAEEVAQGYHSINELFETCFHSDPQIAFRASWILETLCLLHPSAISPISNVFLMRFAEQKNLSSLRHFTRVLMEMLDKKATPEMQLAVQKADQEAIIEALFDLLIDPKTPVAVLANCVDAALCFAKNNDWVKEELLIQIQILMDRGSPALNSRCKRALKKLNKASKKPVKTNRNQ